ncbi:TonB-dependent receptor domain-containing protein [Phenylobacterium sp.]|uniref:TonB-dependent receptor domain-containing protein n=1 Tax=Phenylobacterium sp. TaxID=1871053 RepID=UPI0035B19964
MNHHPLSAAAVVAAVGMAAPAMAQAQTHSFNIPAQDLGSALRAFGQQSRQQIAFDAADVGARKSVALVGEFTAEDGLARLLEGSGLKSRRVGAVIVVGSPARLKGGSASADELSAVVVTGTRIRGAPPTSPVIVRSREQMREEGQNTLADLLRDIPQNFGGGQNPGVGVGVPAANGVNVNGASSINLRGLGSDATLTLLNGRRFSYAASRQSVDVSTIPIDAVDRIEVVVDGASALYGSDAVAGVANIILKRDYDGLAVSALLGGSTDGGGFQQRYGVTTGRRWGSGGVIAAAEYGRQEPVVSSQRDYSSQKPGITLYPLMENYNLLVSGHQDLTEVLTFELDALFNHRRSSFDFPTDTSGQPLYNGQTVWSDTRSILIAPALKAELGGGWQGEVFGAYGDDRARFANRSHVQGVMSEYNGCYCNNSTQLEATADGPLMSLPAGPVRAAFGGGYRSNHFDARRPIYPILKTQEDYYAYGELNLPLVSEAQDLAYVRRLSLNLAARYEKYVDIDEVVTPKIGLSFAPTDALEFKAAWGKSFKAPTLFQQYNVRQTIIYPVARLGASGYPAGATAVLLSGGNADLKPERATTWTAGVVWRPDAVPGLKLEVSYFHVVYKDRIVTPIPSSSQALASPIYGSLVTYAPTTAQVAAAMATTELTTSLVGTLDPATVVALIDNTNRNAAEQRIQGVDVNFRWSLEGLTSGALTVLGDASYLDSQQDLLAGAPTESLSGQVFNPPKLRGRVGLLWRRDALALSGFVNYTGALKDQRGAVAADVKAVATLDLNAVYRSSRDGPLHGVELTASVRNLFDTDPDTIATTLPYEPPFDSTNYTALGRVVSVSATKRW